MECGHGMCQKCFVDLYRSPNEVHCPRCETVADRHFMVNAGTNSELCMCTICEKGFLKESYVRKHIVSVHLAH
jgi:hypothetical protein